MVECVRNLWGLTSFFKWNKAKNPLNHTMRIGLNAALLPSINSNFHFGTIYRSFLESTPPFGYWVLEKKEASRILPFCAERLRSTRKRNCLYLGCVPLGWFGSGSVIQDHLDHVRSNEPINPLWARILRFIWSTMIRVISDHWFWSESSQRNAPLVYA